MQVTIKVIGDKQFISKLEQVRGKLMEFTAAFAVLSRELTDYYGSKPFASEGGIYGDRWEALSPIYARQKAKMYPGRGILVRTGEMKRSFASTITPDALIIGNEAPYFKYHQSTEEPRTKIPRRPVLAVNEEVKSIVQQVIAADVAEKIRGL